MPKPPRPVPAEATVRVPVGTFDTPPEKPAQQLGPMVPVIGWRTELTRELVEMLVVAGSIGGYKRQCALACGVRPELLEFWLSEGMREDAEPLMQELSARFQGAVQNCTLGLVQIIRTAATYDWEAAMALLSRRDALWRGSEKWSEPETAPPATSLAERKRQLVDELREARLNPLGALADALREAGFPLQEPENPGSDGLHALLERGKPETPDDG